ncbi:hypothetical protein [Halostella litorea]|uniref:hypothetical protein n=1 Tax=Halostella litorea TaxID=2528831 RepID=UPI00109260F2|nr:hypothetical protein [Halostella litorea]
MDPFDLLELTATLSDRPRIFLRLTGLAVATVGYALRLETAVHGAVTTALIASGLLVLVLPQAVVVPARRLG